MRWVSRSGFTWQQWPRDPLGIYFGGNDMEFTARQMMAFGELYLNGGLATAARLSRGMG